MNHFKKEDKIVRKNFDLKKVLKFQKHHDIQIIRGGDYQYQCYIDGDAFGSALTPMCALVTGIEQFIDTQFNKEWAKENDQYWDGYLKP